MKLTSSKLAVLALIGTATPLMAVTPVKTYKFQFVTANSAFAPTYVWVTAALDTPTDVSGAITKLSISTTHGDWTYSQFSPATTTPNTVIGSPFWGFGQVEVTGGGNTLLFLSGAQLEASYNTTIPVTVGLSGNWNVDLTTTHLSDSFQTAANPTDDIGGANGNWVNTNPINNPVNTPDASSTAWLMLGAFGLLGAFQYSQRRSVSSNA